MVPTTSEATGTAEAALPTEPRRRIGAWLSAPALSLRVRLGTLALLVAVAISRSPYVFRRGRLWAEEGQYFVHMYDNPGPTGLWYAQTRAGYTNAIANVATWLSAQVPIRHAPRVAVWVSFAVLLVLVWVVLSWPSDLLRTAGSRLAAALVLVVGTLALPEVWVNSINAQVYLGILAVLLLLVPLTRLSRRQFVVGAGLLALAGLSGIYASALAPVFIGAAWLQGGRRRWLYAGILSATAALQVAIYGAARGSGGAGSNRSMVPELGKVYEGLVGHQLAASIAPKPILAPLLRPAERGGNGVVVALLAVVVVVAVVIALRAMHRRVALLLVASFVMIEVVVQVGAIGGLAGGRYAVIPLAIVALTLIGGAASAGARWRRWVSGSMAAVVVAAGLSQFWTVSPSLLRCESCPSWTGEVDRWERGQSAELEIWPYDRKTDWVIVLRREVAITAP